MGIQCSTYSVSMHRLKINPVKNRKKERKEKKNVFGCRRRNSEKIMKNDGEREKEEKDMSDYIDGR